MLGFRQTHVVYSLPDPTTVSSLSATDGLKSPGSHQLLRHTVGYEALHSQNPTTSKSPDTIVAYMKLPDPAANLSSADIDSLKSASSVDIAGIIDCEVTLTTSCPVQTGYELTHPSSVVTRLVDTDTFQSAGTLSNRQRMHGKVWWKHHKKNSWKCFQMFFLWIKLNYKN